MSHMQPMFDNIVKYFHTEKSSRQRIMETERRLVEAGVMEAEEAGDQQQPGPRRGHRRQRRRLPEIPKHKKRNESPQ